MSREPIPTWYFVLVIVRRRDQFLLVQERKYGQRWSLPAGRVEPGEPFVDGAVRETLEEAGIEVRVTGIYRIEHTPRPEDARVRLIVAAEPVSDGPPKSQPDQHSLAAGWFTLEEIAALPLRGSVVLSLFRQVAEGAPLYPLSILGVEDD